MGGVGGPAKTKIVADDNRTDSLEDHPRESMLLCLVGTHADSETREVSDKEAIVPVFLIMMDAKIMMVLLDFHVFQMVIICFAVLIVQWHTGRIIR